MARLWEVKPVYNIALTVKRRGSYFLSITLVRFFYRTMSLATKVQQLSLPLCYHIDVCLDLKSHWYSWSFSKLADTSPLSLLYQKTIEVHFEQKVMGLNPSSHWTWIV